MLSEIVTSLAFWGHRLRRKDWRSPVSRLLGPKGAFFVAQGIKTFHQLQQFVDQPHPEFAGRVRKFDWLMDFAKVKMKSPHGRVLFLQTSPAFRLENQFLDRLIAKLNHGRERPLGRKAELRLADKAILFYLAYTGPVPFVESSSVENLMDSINRQFTDPNDQFTLEHPGARNMATVHESLLEFIHSLPPKDQAPWGWNNKSEREKLLKKVKFLIELLLGEALTDEGLAPTNAGTRGAPESPHRIKLKRAA